MIQYYYGDGKGKTTAALGAILRMAGDGKQVLFAQFLKGEGSSERAALAQIANITLYPVPKRIPFVFRMDDQEREDWGNFYLQQMEDIRLAVEKDTEVKLIVLDEVGDLADAGLVSLQQIRYFLRSLRRVSRAEIILTGHKRVETLSQMADYVTEMRKEKHPFDQGVSARKGIEY